MNIEQIKAQVAEWEVWYKSSQPQVYVENIGVKL